LSQRTRAHTTGATHATTEPATPTPAQTPTQQASPAAHPTSPDDATDATSATRHPSVLTGASVGAPTGAVGAGVEPLARALRAMATELERDPALARRVADAMQTPGQAAHTALAEDAPSPHGSVSAPTPVGRATKPATTLAALPADDTEAEQAVGTPTTRVNRTFHPRIVTGTPPELGAGVPDPFALAERLGEAGLRAALAELRLGSLRAIIREHRLDPAGRLVGQNDAAKFRAVIVEAVHATGVASGGAEPKRTTRKGRKADR